MTENLIVFPTEDLHIYQILFEIEFSKEMIKENILFYCNVFRNDIERLQKCKFEVLNNMFLKDPINIAKYLLEWLKFNFTKLQVETKEVNGYYDKNRLDLENEYLEFLETYYPKTEKEFIEEFYDEKEIYERHKKIKTLKEFTIHRCRACLNGIKIKNDKHIPNALRNLSFPEQYEKFKEYLPEMIKYKKDFKKQVFWRGTISKQFLKWYRKCEYRMENEGVN